MIPEGAVKLAPPGRPSPLGRPSPSSASEPGSQQDHPWLSRDAPYDRMTGMVCSPLGIRPLALSVSPCSVYTRSTHNRRIVTFQHEECLRSEPCAIHAQASTTMEGTQLGAIMLPHLNQQSSFRNRTGTALALQIASVELPAKLLHRWLDSRALPVIVIVTLSVWEAGVSMTEKARERGFLEEEQRTANGLSAGQTRQLCPQL